MILKKVICLIFISALIFLQASLLFALPEGEQVEAGSATFDRPDQATLNIQADDKTVINFNSFNINQGETVNFIQPSASSSLLSRVTGGQMSQIFGILNANGILFLINPQGIYFGPTAKVNVNSFVASTLDISTNNFLAGNYILEHNSSSPYSQILNQGIITGNNIALIASAVANQGTVIGRLGKVFFISGDRATVSFDAKSMIQVEVNEETSGKVFGKDGVEVKDAVANSGTVEGAQVVMEARVAADIFKNAVNQQGIIKATGFNEEDGAICVTANRDIQISGNISIENNPSLQTIQNSSWGSITVDAKFNSTGSTTLRAFKDILVNADINTESGDLELLADADLDGTGSFKQASGTLVATNNPDSAVDKQGKPVGDITIQSSGESTLANIDAAANLILKQGGAPAVFNQWPDARITTGGSIVINPGVTLNAANTLYEIGKDWVNLGNFNAQFSKVSLVSERDALVRGNNVFYDFSITVPGKIVRFDGDSTQAILRNLTLRGEYGKLLVLKSIEPPKQWKINPQGVTDIVYTLIGDSVNIRGPPLKAIHSSSSGNLTNFDLDPYWTGQGLSYFWSDPDNWDTGTTPTAFDTVTFDGITGLNPNKNSIIDVFFSGTIDNLIIDGYAGTLTLNRDLTLRGNFIHNSGNFDPATYTVTFIDASKPSYIYGNNTFYNLTCITPGKTLIFEANSLTTVTNTLTIEGQDGNYITLKSSIAEKGKEFGIYINSVSDAEGNPYLEYLNVYYSRAFGPVIPVPAKHYYIPAELNIDWDDTHTWTGTTSNLWSVGSNWGGSAPGPGDDLVFPEGASNLSTINDIISGTCFANITISGSGYTLAGNLLGLTGNLTDSAASGGNTISLSLILGPNQTISVTNAAQTLTISGVLTDTGGIRGFTKAGSGTLALAAANDYTGTTTINAGILCYGTNDAILTGAITINGGTLDLNGYSDVIGALTMTGGSITTAAGTLTLGGDVITNAASTSATISGNLDLGGATRNFTVSDGAAAEDMVISAVISSTSGVYGITKAGTIASLLGTGTLVLTGANTYTGPTTVNAGVLNIQHSTALGTTLTGTTVASGAALQIQGGITIGNELLTLSGAGIADAAGVAITGALRNISGSNAWGGDITLGAGYTRINSDSGSLTLNGAIYGPTFALTVGGAGNTTISGVIATTTGALTKDGDGTLTLGAANIYTGATTISTGTLTLSGSGTALHSAFTIQTNGTLTLDNSGTNNTNRLGDALAVTLYGGNFNFIGSPSAAAYELAGVVTLGSTSLNGANTITITPGAGGSTTMTFVSLTKTAGATVLFRGTDLGSAPAANVSTLMFYAPPTLTGGGGAAGTTTVSILRGAFGDASLSGTGTDMVTYNVGNTNGLRLLNGAGFSGEYETVSLAVANTNVKLSSSVAPTASATINSLILNSGGAVASSIYTTTFTTGNIISFTGNAGINDTTLIAFGAAEACLLTLGDLTISSLITGTGGLTKSGTGTLTFSFANTYTGTTVINAGTLLYATNDAIFTGNVNIYLGTLNLAGFSDAIGVLAMTGGSITTAAGTLTLGGNVTGNACISTATISGNLDLGGNTRSFTIADGLVEDDMVISAVISVTELCGITKAGTGRLVLSGANTYTGPTTVTAGALSVSTLADGGSPSNIGASTNSEYCLVLNGGTLIYTGGPVSIDRLFSVGTSGGINNSGSGTLTFNNTGAIGLPVSGAHTLTITGSNNLTLAAIIADNGGATAIIKNWTGTLILSAANVYSGAVTVNAGTLTIQNSTALGSAIGATTVANGATLQIDGSDFSISDALTITGTGINSIVALRNLANNNTWLGNITLGTGGAIITTDAGNLTINGIISAAQPLTKNGAGTLTLGAVNTYTGATTINAGTLSYAVNNALAATAITLNGGILDISHFDTVGVVTLISGSIIGTSGVLTGTTSYAVESGTISAILGGGLTLIKSTAGTVTITSPCVYTGATTINAGTLILKDSGTAILSAFTINSGATLTLDNSGTNNTNRLADASAVTLYGGNFNFIGSPSADAYETAGALTLGSASINGANTVTIIPGAGGSTTMTFASLSRTGTTVLFRGTDLGSAPAANVSTLMFATAPALTGGAGAAGTTTVSIIRGAFGDASLSGTGTDMVTYNVGNTNGLRLLNGAGFSNEYLLNSLATTNANVRLTASTTAATITINSLILESGGSVADAGATRTVTFTTGNIISLSGNAGINGATTTIVFGAAEVCLLTLSDLTISSLITGTGGLTKSGTGTLTFSRANTYTGITRINAGTLRYATDDAISSGDVTVFNATYDLNGYSDTIGALTMTGGNITTAAGTLTLGGNVTGNANITSALISGNLDLGGATRSFTLANGTAFEDMVVSAVISSAFGAFGITKVTAGSVLVLSGANTYTGLTTVTTGILNLRNATATGTTAGGVSVASGAALQLQGGITVGVEDLILAGTGVATDGALRNIYGNNTWQGAITLVAATRINSDIGVLTLNGNISGPTFALTVGGVGSTTISGVIGTTSGTLTKDGAGTLTLTNANTYLGLTTLSAGVLNIQNAQALGTTAAGITLTSGAVLQLQGDIIVGDEALTLAGTGISITGALRNISGNNTWQGLLTLTVATRINSDSGTINLTNAGTITGATFALTIGGYGNTTISGIIGTTTGTLTKDGAGTLTLNAVNTYTGTTTISAGTLVYGINNTISTGAVTVNAGIFDISAFSDPDIGTVTLAGGTISGTTGVLSSTANYALQYGTLSAILGAAGGANIGLTKTSAGTVVITSLNTYTGVTTISAGTLSVSTLANGGIASNIGASDNAAANLTLNGGILLYTGDEVSTDRLFTLGSTAGTTINSSGSGTLTFSNTGTIVCSSTTARTLTITGSNNLSLACIIPDNTGATTLVKTGSGTLTLTAANSYSGATTVNHGVLNIQNATATGTIAGGITVAMGAALQIQGGITVGAEALTLSGTGIANDGALRNISGDNTWAGTITLGSVSRINSDSGLLTIPNTVTLTAVNVLRVGGAGNTTVNGVIGTAVAATLTKDGEGTLTLGAANTYTGLTTVSAGTLAYGVNNAISSGGITLNGGTLDISYFDTVGAVILTSGSITGTTGVLTGTAYTVESGTISAILAGAIGLTKNTAGTVTITSPCAYTGATTINAGTLILKDSGTAILSAFTINSGATLTLDNSGTNNTHRLGDALAVTLYGGNFNFIGSPSTDAYETAGALTLGSATIPGANTVTITPGAGGSTIMTFASLTRNAGSTVLFRGTDLGSAPAAKVSTLMFATAPALTGGGGAAGTTTVNIIRGAFGDTSLSGTGTDMVTYNVGNTNGLRLLNGAGFSNEYLLNSLAASANVRLAQATTAATFTINSLILESGGSVADAGVARTITFTTGNIISLTGNSGINGANTTIAFGAAEACVFTLGDLTISGIITGTGGLTKAGTAILTFSGNSPNTYSGTTRVNSGELDLNKTAGLNAFAGALTIGNTSASANAHIVKLLASNQIPAVTVTLYNSGKLDLNGFSDAILDLAMTGGNITTAAGTLTLGGNVTGNANATAATISGNLDLGGATRTFTIADGTTANDMDISALIGVTGAFGIIKAGAGVLVLSGANTYDGSTTITAGTLSVSTLANGLSPSNIGDSSNAATNLVLNGGTLYYTAGAASIDRLFSVGTTAGSTINSSGTGMLTFSNTGAMGFNSQTGARTLTLRGTNNITMAVVIGDNTGATALTKSDNGTLIVTAANTYTGLTTVSAGVLNIQNVTALGATTGATSVTSGAQLQIQGGIIVGAEALTLNGTGISTTGALRSISGNNTWQGAITLAAASRINSDSNLLTLSGNISGAFGLTVGGAGNTTISGIIGTGAGTLTKDWNGTLTLTNANTYTGLTTVSAGVLNIQNATALGTIAAGTSVTNGAQLQIQGNITVGAEALTLSGTGFYNNYGALRSTGNNTWQGLLTLAAASRINSDSGTLSLTNTGTITGATFALTVGGSGNTAITSIIGTTTGTLTKDGAGILTLNGTAANTYTGLTTVIAGELDLNKTAGINAIGGALTIGDGIGGADADIVKLLTANQIIDTSAVTLNNSGKLDLNGLSDTVGALTMTGGSVTTGAGTLTLGGNVTGNTNLTSATVSGNLALGATRTFTIANGAAASDMTVSALISGEGFGITKTDTGTLTLSYADNTYGTVAGAGITTINAGILSVVKLTNGGAASSIGDSSNAATNLVMGGGTLQYTGGTTSTDRNFTLTAATTSSIEVTTTATILTLSGASTNTTGALTKAGSGTLVLSGLNLHTGLTTVTAGTLRYGASNVISTGGVTVLGILDLNTWSDSVGAIIVTGGSITTGGGNLISTSTLTMTGGSVTTGAGTLTLGGNVTGNASTTSSTISGKLDLGGATRTFTINDTMQISAVISVTGAFGISKAEIGTLILTGANTYTGTTAVTVGILNIQNATALGTIAAGTTVSSGAQLQIQGDITVGAEAMTLNGSGIANTGALRNISGNNTWQGLLTLAAATRINSDSGTLNLTNAGTITGATFALTLGGTGNGTLASIIGTTTGTLTKDGLGTWTLSAANTYTGATTISQGVLNIQNATALGTIAAGTTVISGACLQIQGGITVGAETLTLNGTGIATDGALRNISGNNTCQGAITLNNGAPFITIASDADTLTLTGGVTGNGYVLIVGGAGNVTFSTAAIAGANTALTKNGAGTLTFNFANTYTGTTTINAGTLLYGVINAISTGGVTVNGGTLDIVTYTDSVGTVILISGAINGTTGILTSTATYDVRSGTISAIITGAVGLTKTTSGTVVLSGANTYTGLTTVSAGVLNIQNATATGTTAGGVTVTSGACLQIQGGITVGAETLTLNGTGIATDGALRNISGNNTCQGGIILGATGVRINSDSDLLTLSGGITGATFALTVGGAGNTTISSIIGTTTGTLTKDGAGTLTLSAVNTYTGITTVSAGNLTYGINDAISTGNITIAGGTLDIVSYLDTVGAVALTSGTITGTTGILTGTGTVYAVENGFISAILSGSIGLSKNTAGVVTITSACTYTGATTINAGTLTLKDSGSILNTTGITINYGGTLTLDNSATNNTNRLPDALAVTMYGGNFNFIGSPSTDASETAGALTLGSASINAANSVTITPGAGGSTTMTFASLVRNAGNTVLFRGTDLGSTPAVNVSTLMFTAAPALTGGSGVAGTTTVSIIRGAFGDASLSGTGTDMVTYNVGNTNGLRLLNGAGFSGEYATDLSTTNSNVKLASAVTASIITINSLILDSGGSVADEGSAQTLTFTTGNIISLTGNSGINGANTTIDLVSVEGCILTLGDLAVSAIIAGSSGGSLTKAGAGTLTLSAANTYTGLTTISAGMLLYGTNNAIFTGNVAIFNATLDLNGYSDTIAALTMTGGSVTTAAGILTLGGNVTGNANATSATISGNLDFGTATRTFTIADGTAAYDMVISAVISSASGAYGIIKAGTGTLVLSGANTYTGLTTLTAGILTIQNNTALGTPAGVTTVATGAMLQIDGSGLSIAEPLNTLIGTGVGGAGALRNLANSNTWTGAITLGAGGATITCASGLLILTGGITGTGLALTITGAGNTTISTNGINTSTAGTLTKTGAGTLTISASGDYTGLTTLTAGILTIQNNTALGTPAGVTTVATGAMLQIDGSGL
ncbi:MAG: autotransporter-associated beta strand repeat-containing protein, partial [Syntrophales bacterium]